LRINQQPVLSFILCFSVVAWVFTGCTTMSEKVPPTEATGHTVVMAVKVPPVDTTRPTEVRLEADIPNHPLLNAYLWQPSQPKVSASTRVGANDVIKLEAFGTDPDGGVKKVSIYIALRACLSTSIHGISVIQLEAKSEGERAIDESFAKIGELTPIERSVAYTLDVQEERKNYDGVLFEVHAIATNFSGLEAYTGKLNFGWGCSPP
jgi:hypothetical protein